MNRRCDPVPEGAGFFVFRGCIGRRMEGFSPVRACGVFNHRVALGGDEIDAGEPGLVELPPQGIRGPLIGAIASTDDVEGVLDGDFVIGTGQLELGSLSFCLSLAMSSGTVPAIAFSAHL